MFAIRRCVHNLESLDIFPVGVAMHILRREVTLSELFECTLVRKASERLFVRLIMLKWSLVVMSSSNG